MNDAELHLRASELFLALRRRAAHERDAALAEACGDDARLRDEVAELLANDADDAPTLGAALRADGAAPERIGPYRILGRLGRGGSGQVFLGEQSEPIRRRVAIKVVPQAAVDPELAARFEVERRALERTDHPNIARVLDAGRTADGLPYLVIDYVEGVALRRHCDEQKLDVRARIELVLQVADAIEHAHQRGVIHRDLKPANILVAQVDGRATPRVLDFGIAKPIAGAFADESPRTSGLPVGTPAYMAPEQTGVGAVDTRADVYALGAVLYELVTGRPPLDARGDPLAVLQRVRDEIPLAASRVRAQSALAGEPVAKALLADLDRVLAKTLEKQPERRYATVSAFAADLRRVLRCEPIEARPPTLGYRAARFARRNRVLVASAAAVTLALIIGLIGLIAGLVEADRQRREALDQTAAQREINRFLTEDLLAAASPDQLGPRMTARELLDRAGARIDLRLGARPVIAAAIHHALGGAYAELGLSDEANSHYATALELRRAHLGSDAADTLRTEIAALSLRARNERSGEVADTLQALAGRTRAHLGADEPALYSLLNDLGVVLMSLGRERESVAHFEEALEHRTRLLGEHHREVFVTAGNLAHVLGQLGDTRECLRMTLATLAIAGGLPDEPRYTLLALCNNIGATYQDLGEDENALPYLQRAAELAGEVLGADHADALTIQGNLAGLEADLGHPERAAELYSAVVERMSATLGADAEPTLTARYGRANALWKAGRHAEAAAEFERVLADSESALGPTHWQTAQTRVSLAAALLDGGRARDALPHAELGATQLLELYGDDHERARGAAVIAQRIREQLNAQ